MSRKKGSKIKKPLLKGAAKVPVVMQMEDLECGAASLTMILAYYDKWLPLEQVRADCGVSHDGSNAKNILKAARSYGLVAKGYRYELKDLKNKGKFSCIAHWNFNHFLVLNDPAKGSYSVPISSFLGVIQPVFSRIFLDRLLTGQNPEWFYPFLFALALFLAVQIIIAWIQAIWSLRIDGKLAVTGSAVFMWKVFRLPMEFFS